MTKPCSEDALLHAISSAMERSHKALLKDDAPQIVRDRYDSLTKREREVMDLVASGLVNKQIGGKLGISEITVKAHRGKVMQKMNAPSLPDLVRMHATLFG